MLVKLDPLLTSMLRCCGAAEKAAEVRAELANDPRPTTAVGGGQLPADSRSASVHLCGFDIQGVSIAGQVRPGNPLSAGL